MVGIARYGWNTTWQARRTSAPANEWGGDVVRVITAHRGAYHVVGDAGTCWAELPGRSYHRAADRRELPVVGDWVIAERVAAACTGDGAARIIGVLPRTSFLVRRAAGRATEPQPIVANVDLGFIVTSLNTDLSLPRLDRYLAMLREGNITPTVVLSKADRAGTGNQRGIATAGRDRRCGVSRERPHRRWHGRPRATGASRSNRDPTGQLGRWKIFHHQRDLR